MAITDEARQFLNLVSKPGAYIDATGSKIKVHYDGKVKSMYHKTITTNRRYLVRGLTPGYWFFNHTHECEGF